MKIVICLVIAAALSLGVLASTFRYSSVCGQCGAVLRATDWQLPLSRTTWLHTSPEKDTPLSRCLQTNSIVAAHQHQWIFCHGGGNGMRCALGTGGFIEATAESAEVACLIATLSKFQEHEFRDRMLTNIFNPRMSRVVESISRTATNFSSRESLRAWIDSEADTFDKMLGSN